MMSVDLAYWGSVKQLGQHTLNICSSANQEVAHQLVRNFAEALRTSDLHIGDLKEELAADHSHVDVYNSSVLATEIKKVHLDLRLSGQRCPDLMKAQLQHFFKSCGIKQYEFEWGPNYWATSRDKLRVSADEKQRKEDTEFVEKEEKVMMDKEKKSTLDKLKFWKRKK